MKHSIPSAISLAAILFFAAGAAAAEDPAGFTLNENDYSFAANVKSPDRFDAWRSKVLYFYHKTLRIRPDYQALPPDVKFGEKKRIGDRVTRYEISYATTDGLRIPAFLFVPDTEAKVPAVIVYHGHGPGKINAAEGENTNETALARYLAEKLGYVTLAPDARSFGEFKIPGKQSHYDYYFSLIFKNKLYMSKLMEDGYQDLALLRTVERADPERLGVAGISMGSWRTLNFTVMHGEVDAAVVAGLYIPWKYLFSEAHCRCQHVPKLAEKLGMADLAATVFPRKLMIQWGLEDGFYKQEAEDLISKTAATADFLGCPDSFRVDRHEGMGHRFSNPEIAEFFVEALGQGAWPPEN